jgi:dihydroorotate dehydrogenase (fumarate)
MIDLTTKYGKLKLKNPIVAGSSGLTDNVESLKEIEQNGAGAVVLKSLFEEEIVREMESALKSMSSGGNIYPEALESFDYYDGPKESTTGYLDLITIAKAEVEIPVIASINCIDAEYWTYFPKQIEQAGADALELNIFNLPSDLNRSADEYEQVYFNIIKQVQEQINIPLFIKLSFYSSHLGSFLRDISKTGIDGLVLFNRFYNPDIDIESLEITSGSVLSSPSDIHQSLRWIAILSGQLDCNLIASTGVHSAEGVIKQILAGASAVQIASTLYKNGIPYLSKIINDLKDWMAEKEYKSLDDFRGKLSQNKSVDPALYSRVQFMKYFRGFTSEK